MTLEHGILIYGFYDSFLDNIADALSRLVFDLHFEEWTKEWRFLLSQNIVPLSNNINVCQILIRY